MEHLMERVNEDNYALFDAMLRWRETGEEQCVASQCLTEDIRTALHNPNLYVYAVRIQGRYVGWLSAIYMPKVSKWRGRGHVYVDEMWVAPPFRRQGLGRALLGKADELAQQLNAWGVRLYVNVENPGAKQLYESCGYQEAGQAFFMEK